MKDFEVPGTLAPTGLFLGGTKYMVIQGEAGAVIRGKKVRFWHYSLLYNLRDCLFFFSHYWSISTVMNFWSLLNRKFHQLGWVTVAKECLLMSSYLLGHGCVGTVNLNTQISIGCINTFLIISIPVGILLGLMVFKKLGMLVM